MPINQLVDFSHSSIKKNGKCSGCIWTCSNCNNCLQDIHFGSSTRGYDCQNMIYCYTCSYIYKYASEIHYLFKKLPLGSFSEFNILSLGCGSCADLFGIDNFLTEQTSTIPIQYRGIDFNPLWGTTHNKIKEIFLSYSIDFEEIDIFEYLDNLPEEFNPPNILILQYVLIELISHNKDTRVDMFVDDLVAKIINKMPENSVVIFNDINLDCGSKKIRTWFNKILEKCKNTNDISLVGGDKYRFIQPTSHTFGGIKHEKDGLLFKTSPLVCNVKQPCSAVQMMIFKKKNK